MKDDKEKQINSSKRDYLDDSSISVNSEINFKKNDYEDKRDNNKLEIIEEESKYLVDDTKRGTYNIMVVVRCRPLSNKEKEISDLEIVKIQNRKIVLLKDPTIYNGPNDIFKNRSREQSYAFDFAFEKTCNTQTVYNHSTKFLLDGVLNGYNATVFAYGSTGAGKTHTMLGTEDQPAIMPLTLKELFKRIDDYSQEREYKIKLWYLEIYNENLRDLLSNSEEYMDLREDPIKGILIPNILEITVTSCKDIMHLLKRGNRNRTQESTMANEASSRSHAILQVQVEYKEKATDIDSEIKIGKLSLIDLAGSERASATQNRGIRLIEGANINRSLLTLGNCINALCEANEKGTKPHVPYRDSKLTRLLKDSLGGNSRTVMIANVSPFVGTFEDTYNTLKYANRAKNIKTHLQRNVIDAQNNVANYNNIISNLRSEITELKTQLSRANQNISIGNDRNYLNLNNKDNLIANKEDRAKTSSSISQSHFVKILAELNTHFEEEIVLKQKVLEQEQEIINITEILKNMGNSAFQNHNDIIDVNCIETTINYENSININNTIGNTIDYDNIVDIKEPEKDNNIRDKSKERENKMVEILNKLKKTCETNTLALKEKIKKREVMIAVYNKQGLRELQYDYLQSLTKTHNAKLLIIESRFKENISRVMSYIKENYIAELESQIKLRDKYIDRGEIFKKIIDEEESKKFKSVDDLKKEYANKLPIISIKTVDKMNKNLRNSFLDKNLPPISSNIPKDDVVNLADVNSILSEVRMISNNLSKIEMNQLHNHIKQDRIKRKADFLNLKENQKEKLVQIRNFSNAVRNNNKFNLVSNNNIINTMIQPSSLNNNSAHNITPNINTTIIENNVNKQFTENKIDNTEIESIVTKPPLTHKKVILEHKAKIKKLKVNEITNFTPIRKLNDSVSNKSSNRSQVPSGENSHIGDLESLDIPKHNNFADGLANIQKYTVSDDESVRASKRNIHDLKEIRRRIKQESTSPKMSKDLNFQLAKLDRITSSKRIDIPNNKDNESANNKKREGSLFQNEKAKLKNLKKIPFKI